VQKKTLVIGIHLCQIWTIKKIDFFSAYPLCFTFQLSNEAGQNFENNRLFVYLDGLGKGDLQQPNAGIAHDLLCQWSVED